MKYGIVLNAPAKLNLFLGVHPQKDSEGYHHVDSVMSALELSDTIEITFAKEWSFTCNERLECAKTSNLVFKAAHMLSEATGHPVDFSVNLIKRIPSQAGLGGGSSDGAAVLYGLAKLWDLDPQGDCVLSIAHKLGADVPFFLYEGPAYFTGRGDQLQTSFATSEAETAMPQLNVVLVKALGSAVSTREAYEMFDANPTTPGDLEGMLEALERRDKQGIVQHISNNFDEIAEHMEPGVEDALLWLRARPKVQAVCVCGSGACVAGICEKPLDAKQIADDAAQDGFWGYATRTKTKGVSAT